MEKEVYCKSVQRPGSLTDLKAWYIGESSELKKWIGFGFFNHLFFYQNKLIQLYYNLKEGNEFHNVLKQKLTEDLFDNLSNNFFELIEESEKINSHNELFKIMIKSWPAFTIFDEISKYPEFATESMIRRLRRIRTSTESFSYELSKRLNHELEPNECIFYKGNTILESSHQHFINKNNMILENE